MRYQGQTTVVLVAIILVISSCYYDNKEDLYQYVIDEECTITEATFTTDIVSLLEIHCNRCHRNDRQDGNVNLEGYAQVKPYADSGALLGSAEHSGGFATMPPSESRIPFCEIEKIRLWVTAGAQNN